MMDEPYQFVKSKNTSEVSRKDKSNGLIATSVSTRNKVNSISEGIHRQKNESNQQRSTSQAVGPTKPQVQKLRKYLSKRSSKRSPVVSFFRSKEHGVSVSTNSKKLGAQHSSSMLSHIYNRQRQLFRSLFRHKLLKIAQVMCALYIAFCTFSYSSISPRDPITGWILDTESPERTSRGVILINGAEQAIVATTSFQMVCLGITRCSAFFMYPGKRVID